jgi:prepilin-type N-terminal cleavage/methylation domain-containing protein
MQRGHLQMLRKLNKSKEGFTIIEVLIVLAIAGLIMLIVFLAVPALQRNARNTTQRSDVSKALGAVGEFVANNNGKLPVSTDVGALQTAANLSSGTTLTTSIPTKQSAVVAPAESEVEIVTGVKCDPAATNKTAASLAAADFKAMVIDSSARSYVALFSVEASGGNRTTQCQGS